MKPGDVLVAPGAVAEDDGITLQVSGSGWLTGPSTGEEFSGTFHILVSNSLERPIRVRAKDQIAEMADRTAYEAVDVLFVPSIQEGGANGLAARDEAAQTLVIPPRKQRSIEIPFPLPSSGEPLPVPKLVVFTIGDSRFVVEDPLG